MQVIAESKVRTKADIRKRAWIDTEFFNNFFLPHHFYLPSAKVHSDIDALVWSNYKFVSVIAPRKIGKTPRICLSYPVKNICYNTQTYIVVISATKGESERHVLKATKEIEANEKIHYYFGNLVDRRNYQVTRDSVQFTNGIWFRAKGAMGQIRGTGGDYTPPSLIIIDDPQSNKDVKSEMSLQNAINWFDDNYFVVVKSY